MPASDIHFLRGFGICWQHIVIITYLRCHTLLAIPPPTHRSFRVSDSEADVCFFRWE